jgi:hypothetical protein
MLSRSLVLASLLTTTAAHAEERSYAAYTVGADLATASVFGTGVGTDLPGLAVTGYLGFIVTTPLIHLSHNRPAAALGSFAMRATVPLAAGYLMLASGACRYAPDQSYDGGICTSAPMLGITLGMVTVATIDGLWLANESKPAKPSDGARIVPTAGFTNTGATFGLAGVF